jgi:hypothetical protein
MTSMHRLFVVALCAWALVVGSVLVWEMVRGMVRGAVLLGSLLRRAAGCLVSGCRYKRRKKRRHLVALRAEAQRILQDTSDRRLWKRSLPRRRGA